MTNTLVDTYLSIRRQTLRLVEGLSAEDLVLQSMPDASPAKWHLAHTTWFFEAFFLQKKCKHYTPFNPQFQVLFNSYYNTVGEQHPRPQRGMLARPSLDEVLAYRHHVDKHMVSLLTECEEISCSAVTVGLHHEMQHQELLLTDLLHLFSLNPLKPPVMTGDTTLLDTPVSNDCQPYFKVYSESLTTIGCNGPQKDTRKRSSVPFSYDCERPAHSVFMPAFRMSNRLVTNREWLAFMDDGGYKQSLLWLSDGWLCKERNNWCAPLYWIQCKQGWQEFGLDGLQPVNLSSPVCHVSYYEADAYARWAGKRLPYEYELEKIALQRPIEGQFLEQLQWRPQPAESTEGMHQIYGDVWEWTQSAYSAYPGFIPERGALGEYNGKFMANQFVLKGGSCVTPKALVRASYRNFFHPQQRWQFSGLRLAE